MGAFGLVACASKAADSHVAVFLTCVFLVWPAFVLRRVHRDGKTITIRTVSGTEHFVAKRCMIGLRIDGWPSPGGHTRWSRYPPSVEYQVYITDGQRTRELTAYNAKSRRSTRRVERDIPRLVALLLDPDPEEPGAGAMSGTNDPAVPPGTRRARHVRSSLSGTGAARNAAVMRIVEADREKMAAGWEGARSQRERIWRVNRKIWFGIGLVWGVLLLGCIVMFLLQAAVPR